MHYQVRPMRPGDVDGILAVQALAYPGFLLESAGFFLNRLALADTAGSPTARNPARSAT